MKLSRREFATSMTKAISLAYLANLSRANAANLVIRNQEEDPHFFVFIQIYGAWDVCLAFDPKDRELILPNGEKQFDQPYSMNDVREFSGIKLAPDGFAFGRLADRMAIVNGIDMEFDNGHISDAVMSGFQNARQIGAPYVQAILAKKHPYLKRRSIPHLYTSYDGQFIAGPYGTSSVSATGKDFLAFISPENGSDHSSEMSTLQLLLSEFNATLPQSRRKIFGGYSSAVQSAQNVNSMLKKFGFRAPQDVDGTVGLANLLGQLFASGVLGSATLSFGSKFSFDTHSNHYKDHPLKNAIGEIDLLVKELQSIRLDDNHSVFDRTTLVLTAEYGRTPRLNSFEGKDHNFRTNSMVFLGHKVRPGTYGSSGLREEGDRIESHAGLTIDFATGQPTGDSKKILHARNLWAGFGGISGVDLTQDFGQDAEPIRFLG